MSETNETIADIVAEMREMVHKSVDGIIAVKADVIADRLEAAWKRDEEHAVEHATAHAEAVARGNCRDCVHNPQGHNYEGGNTAAMREALVKVKKSIDGIGASSLDCDPMILMASLTQVCARLSARIDAALSKPPRNCDRFKTRIGARNYFDDFVCLRSNGSGAIGCKGCPLDSIDNLYRADCREAWLFATAKRKGESDGK